MSLRARLTSVLTVLFLAVGAFLLFAMLRGSRMYFEEVHYGLNRDVATHVAKSLAPFDGEDLDQKELQTLFMDVMRINPSLEVYLLDTEGRILAFDAPPGSVVRERVELGPVRETLAGEERVVPLRGDDPRDATGRKPFSVAELREDGVLKGYLYVILGGQAYQQLATSLRESTMLRWSAGLLVGSVLLAVLAGAASIGLLTRPLQRLRAAMVGFREGRTPEVSLGASNDEIGELARTFEQMAARIAAQIEQLRENDRRRREFVANVSHDLRTPTGAIQGYLEALVLRSQRLSEDEREQFLRSALRQTERLGRLVDQLFELARLEAREFAPQRELFSLAELAQDVVAKFQGSAELKGVLLDLELGHELPPIRADIGLLERALDNLLDNAIRYTEPGGTVRVSVVQAPGGVGLSVSDTGSGIPGDDLPRVFDRFYRVERPTGHEVDGTGLGLAITKRIVELHEGDIEVDSEPDRGTTFSIVLAAADGLER
jgi:signal transduction histidine kinase